MPENHVFNALSVIIPTYNRQQVLARALEGYLSQSSLDVIYELLVIDDGSTDGTESMVRAFRSRSPFPIHYLRQPNKGPAAARNLGIREAASSIVLFTDSDIVPDRELVAQHLEWHRKNPQAQVAVLGYVTWPAAIKATPFMRWYGEHGALFQYGRLRGKREADDFHFFYTCNLSLKTEFLRACGQFDEEFKTAAYEDIELGYRLSKRGLRLLYNSAAIGYHYQFFSFGDACRKLRANAAAARLFVRKVGGQQEVVRDQEKRFHAGRAIAKRIVIEVLTNVSPSRSLLNSFVPLPQVIYELLLTHDADLASMPTEVITAEGLSQDGCDKSSHGDLMEPSPQGKQIES